MSGAIEWLLWRILHLLFSICCAISALLSRSSLFISSFNVENRQLKTVAAEKKPLTVAVVFETQEAEDKDGKVSQLLLWLSKASVTHVTLYDAQGILKRLEGKLQWRFRGNSPETDDKKIECYSEVSHMKVEVLSLQDGKGSLVRAARDVCENAYKLHYAEKSSKGPKLTEEDINRSLQATGGEGPDPDLLLLFGRTRSLLGFPPWRLRLTEIVHMGSLKDLTAEAFVSALRDFANRTHRYGR